MIFLWLPETKQRSLEGERFTQFFNFCIKNGFG
jgi:hypothetical protein